MALREPADGTIRWEVEIRGEPKVLQFLAARFTQEECRVSSLEGAFVLTSTLLDTTDSSEDVAERLPSIVAILNGLTRLCQIDTHPVELGVVWRLRSDGARDVIVLPELTEVWLRPENPPEEDRRFLGRALSQALGDCLVRAALSVLAIERPSWSQLYLIHELMRQDPEGRDVLQAKSKEVRRFTHTANCYESLGIHSRHVKMMGQGPPRNPMAWSRALLLQTQLVREWVSRKSPCS